jgi:hypothetical protein
MVVAGKNVAKSDEVNTIYSTKNLGIGTGVCPHMYAIATQSVAFDDSA